MKTIEEKAKAYDAALEKAEGIIKYYKECNRDEASIEDLETIFPELKESEGGKIREWLIEYFDKINDEIDIQDRGKIISWLEKQGTPTDINPSEFDLRLNKLLKQFETLPKEELVNCLSFYLNTVQNDGIYKRADNPADKIELKFKVGDWVVNTVGDINQVVKVLNDGYTLDDNTFISNSWATEHYHLWTIADAKDGDVLVDSYSKDSIIILYKGIYKERSILAHCGWNGYNLSIKTNGLGYGGLDNTNYSPATKEQRDLLFQKMKEAGYEWDAEKKELKKIDARKNLTLDGDLMEADCMIVERKPAWSEEDEHRVKDTIYFLDTAKKHYASTVELDACINWLKSLKQRIGGEL